MGLWLRCKSPTITYLKENPFSVSLTLQAQLGHGDRNNVGLPKLVHNLRSEKIVDAAVGGGHILYITEDNRVLAIGRGRNGQLGREGNIESIAAYRADPVEVRRLNALKVKQVAAGSDHSLAITDEATQ